MGLAAKTPQSAGMATVPLIMLPFFSSAIVPAAKMGQGIRQFAEYQPFTPIIESLRGLLDGAPSGGYVDRRPRLVRRDRHRRVRVGGGHLQEASVTATRSRPAGLRALPSRLGEPRVAEAAPRFRSILASSGWERSGSPRSAVARREQPRGLLVLAAAQRQVRDPDEYLREQRRVPRLGRRLAGRRMVRAGLRRGRRRGSRAGPALPRGCPAAPPRRPAWLSRCRAAGASPRASPAQRASSACARASSTSASGQGTRSA